MKSKYIFWALSCVLLISSLSCVDDQGSYDYRELNDLTINRFKEKYVVEQFTKLQIIPDILASADFDSTAYDYVWHIYSYLNYSISDTLSLKKNLDAEIATAPGDYRLIFCAKNKESGVSYTQETDIQVINSYSIGLLTLSNVGDEANVTFINIANSVIEDAYKKVNGVVAGKNPTGIRYVARLLSGAQKIVVIMTDDKRGGVVVDPLDMTYLMDFSKMFYFAPAVMKPQSFGTHDYTAFEYVINDGDIYSRAVMGEGPFPKYGIRIKGNYKVAPFNFFSAIRPQVAYFYDQNGMRFVKMNVPLQGDAVILLSDIPGEFNPANMGLKMVWGGLFGSAFSMTNGRGVMVDNSGNHYMISFQVNADKNIVPLKKYLMDKEGGKQAHSFTTASTGKYLYYAYDNKIACVSFSTGNLMSVYEFDGGNVDYIECDQIDNVNHLWVGVSDGSTKKKSGSIYTLDMGTDGSLKEVEHHLNVCGKVVDFEYKK